MVAILPKPASHISTYASMPSLQPPSAHSTSKETLMNKQTVKSESCAPVATIYKPIVLTHTPVDTSRFQSSISSSLTGAEAAPKAQFDHPSFSALFPNGFSSFTALLQSAQPPPPASSHIHHQQNQVSAVTGEAKEYLTLSNRPSLASQPGNLPSHTSAAFALFGSARSSFSPPKVPSSISHPTVIPPRAPVIQPRIPHAASQLSGFRATVIPSIGSTPLLALPFYKTNPLSVHHRQSSPSATSQSSSLLKPLPSSFYHKNLLPAGHSKPVTSASGSGEVSSTMPGVKRDAPMNLSNQQSADGPPSAKKYKYEGGLCINLCCTSCRQPSNDKYKLFCVNWVVLVRLSVILSCEFFFEVNVITMYCCFICFFFWCDFFMYYGIF